MNKLSREFLRAPDAVHLPGAGLVLGVAAGIAFAVTSLLLPEAPLAPAAAAIACTMVTAALTGAAEENRLAAAWGPVALVLGLGLKVALLAVIAATSPAAVLAALVAAHALSRFCAALRQLDRAALRIALAWCVVPVVLMLVAGRFAFTLPALAGMGIAYWLLRRHALLAVAQPVCELAFYLGAAIGAGIAIGGGR